MKEQAILFTDESMHKASSTQLENVNRSALPSVQTSFTTQTSKGCKVTAHFAVSQSSDIDHWVAGM